MKLNLSYRFNLYIGGILIIGLSMLLYYDYRSNADLLRSIALNESQRLSATLQDQLLTSMRLGGGRNENRAIVERFRKVQGVEDIRVVHGPSIDRQFGIEEDEVPRDEYDRAALDGETSEVIKNSPAGYRVASAVLPVFYEKSCLECHRAMAGEVAGAVAVTISLEAFDSIIASHARNSLAWGGGILIFTTVALLITVRKRLLEPLEALKTGTEKLTKGDTSYRVSINTGDEFEVVGRAFNKMTDSLLTTTSMYRSLDEKHSKLVDMAADAILLQDVETKRFVDANPAAEMLTGYSRAELLSMRSEDLYPAEKYREYLLVFKRWKHDGRGYLHDAVVIRKDGSTVPVEIAASLLELEGRTYIQEIWRDLSERKGFEETINRYIEELEDTVRSRTAELNKSLTELELAYTKLKESEQSLIQTAKLRSLGEMGAGIAHELNSPLAGILSITEVLMGRLSPEDKNYHLLEKVKDAAVRSKYIILDMLTYSRQSKGKYSPIFLNETIRATLCMFVAELKTTSIEIVEDFDPKLPKVSGNQGQLMEVFLNIIKNARDAMDGKGTIYIKTRAIDRDGTGFAVAEIRDTGPGITPDVLENIFDPFFSTKEKGGGTNIGLGLSISQSIVVEHGGSIDVLSKPGQGATFTVTVPLAEEEEDEKEQG